MRTYEMFDIKNKKQISVISIAHGLNEFYAVVLPPVLPLLVSDFGITYGQAGLLMTVFFAMYAIFQLPAGMLADRVGQVRLLLIGMLILITGIFLISVASSFKALIFAQIIAGIGGSTYHPTGMSLISDFENVNTESRAMGIHGFGGMIGVAAAPVLVGGITTLVNWRVALLVCCLVGLGATIILSIAFRDRLEEEQEQSTLAVSDLSVSSMSFDMFTDSVQPGFRVPLTKWVVLLLVAHLVVSIQVRSIQTFTTTYVFTQGSGSTTVANAAFFAVLIGGSLSSLWIGDLADRFNRGLLGGFVSIITTVLLISTSVVSRYSSLFLLLPWFFIIGIALYAPSPIKNALASTYSKKEFSGSLFGLMQTASAVGSAVGPAIFGYVAERYGEAALYPGIAVICLITSVVFITFQSIQSNK